MTTRYVLQNKGKGVNFRMLLNFHQHLCAETIYTLEARVS